MVVILLVQTNCKVSISGRTRPNPAANKQGPLENVGGDHKIKSNTTVAVSFEKRHQKAKTNEHHTMHIHKHFNKI